MLHLRLLRRAQTPLAPLTRSQSIFSRPLSSTSWRSRSILQADEESLSRLPGLDASKLSVTETITPKRIVPPEELVFGRTFTGLHSTTPLRLRVNSHVPRRPHALHGMDSVIRLARATHYTLPKPLPRPCNLCLPLRLRMLRRHESLPLYQRLLPPTFPP